MRGVSIMLMFLALAACQRTMGDVLHDIPHTSMTQRFDRDAAALALKPGAGRINGRVALPSGLASAMAIASRASATASSARSGAM